MPTLEQTISSVVVTPQHSDHESQPIKTELPRTLTFGAVAAALLLWVALYNGYPTVLPDSGNYLSVGAFRIALFPFRAPGYAVFTHWSSFGRSAWFTVAAQATIVAYVLHEACSYLIGGDWNFRDRCLLGTVCALAVLTGLPWFRNSCLIFSQGWYSCPRGSVLAESPPVLVLCVE